MEPAHFFRARAVNLFGTTHDQQKNEPLEATMNHSLLTADRATHIKIVVVALIGATVVAGVGIGARMSGRSSDDGIHRIEASTPVIKAGAPITVSSSQTRTVR